MTTSRARGKVAKRVLERSIKLLSPRARETVIESFCMPHCGRVPSGEFCPAAGHTYRIVLSLLLEYHVGRN